MKRFKNGPRLAQPKLGVKAFLCSFVSQGPPFLWGIFVLLADFRLGECNQSAGLRGFSASQALTKTRDNARLLTALSSRFNSGRMRQRDSPSRNFLVFPLARSYSARFPNVQFGGQPDGNGRLSRLFGFDPLNQQFGAGVPK